MNRLKPDRIILIGASTGGPTHIEKILMALGSRYRCCVIIGQHMGAAFIPSFVKRLKEQTKTSVSLLEKGMALEMGKAYLCTGRVFLALHNHQLVCSHVEEVLDHYNPDINALFNAFVPYAGELDMMAMILTGIGEDGVQGCRELAQNGALCIAESEESAVVYGMPLRAKEIVGTIEVKSLAQIIDRVKEFAHV